MNRKLFKTWILYIIIATMVCGKVYCQGVAGCTPLKIWRCSNGNATLNFNQALRIDSSLSQQNTVTSLDFDSVPFAKDYTTIIVSKPLLNQETPLWALDFSNSGTAGEAPAYQNTSRGLSSEVIHCGNSSIRYTESTKAFPAIFNALGEVVLSKHIDSKQSHMVEGYLPVGGEYYVTVTTAEGSQTTKLVVKR